MLRQGPARSPGHGQALVMLLAGLAVLLVAILWLASGRERLTKSAKPVTVVVADELFGDAQTRTELRPGPMLGWYVGLDVVAITTGAAGMISGIAILRARRRSKGSRKVENANG